jgi:uncharacterized protein (TIGR03083 family)
MEPAHAPTQNEKEMTMSATALPIAAEVTVPAAAHIPAISRAEVQSLGLTTLERFITLAESLSPEEWNRPTMCTAWRAREILAHQAGSYTAYTTFKQWLHNYGQRPRPGQLPEDVTNALQVADRAGHTPAEMMAELRAAGPIAIANRASVPGLFRLIRIPRPTGTLALSHLLDVIHSRDTWMHRLDLARATGRDFVQTAEHDGRIVALVIRDVVEQWEPLLAGQTVTLRLTGVAGGEWRFGPSAAPALTLTMDALEFNIFASGRMSAAEAKTRLAVSGDAALAERLLSNTLVLY